MKVLDIGSGAGDVAMTAAELVGPEGAVVGVDVNAEILDTAQARAQEAGLTNVEFVAGDARTLELGNDFDALTGRLVLMYMADPADALKQLATRLRPGGIVAFQEADFTPYRQMERPDTPVANNLINWVLEVFERSGAHIDMGFGLYRAFVEAGLPEPYMHFESPVGGPDGWAGYQYAANSFQSLLPAPRRVRNCDRGRGRYRNPRRADSARSGDGQTPAGLAAPCNRLGAACELNDEQVENRRDQLRPSTHGRQFAHGL